MRTFFALFLTLLVSQTAAAAANPPGPDCGNTHSTPELNDCERKLYEAADRALNSEYKNTRARLSPPARAKLLQDQRAWVKQRDPTCKADLTGEEGGTIWKSLYSICLAEATRERTQKLRTWIGK